MCKPLVGKDQNRIYHSMRFMMNLTLPTPVLGKLKQGFKWSAAHVIKGRSCFSSPACRFPLRTVRARMCPERLGSALPGILHRILHELPLRRKPMWAEGYFNSINEWCLTINCYAVVNYSLPRLFCCIIHVYICIYCFNGSCLGIASDKASSCLIPALLMMSGKERNCLCAWVCSSACPHASPFSPFYSCIFPAHSALSAPSWDKLRYLTSHGMYLQCVTVYVSLGGGQDAHKAHNSPA